jgi:hypothetical protein
MKMQYMHSRRVLFTLITATLIYAGCGPMSSTVSVNDTTNPQRIEQAAQDYLSYRGTTQEMAKARAFLSTLHSVNDCVIAARINSLPTGLYELIAARASELANSHAELEIAIRLVNKSDSISDDAWSYRNLEIRTKTNLANRLITWAGDDWGRMLIALQEVNSIHFHAPQLDSCNAPSNIHCQFNLKVMHVISAKGNPPNLVKQACNIVDSNREVLLKDQNFHIAYLLQCLHVPPQYLTATLQYR